ncbi:MAG TPA: DMT family transporter [Opitutaceae bacterium]|nr:DMT family transporter [Opitutaceae bacterium]
MPVAILTEWVWLGTTLRLDQIGWGVVILAGVVTALYPTKAKRAADSAERAGQLAASDTAARPDSGGNATDGGAAPGNGRAVVPPHTGLARSGLFLAFLAAVGQGVGAVISRKANALTALAGEPIDGMTAAYQRIVGGLAITVVYFAVRSLLIKKPDAPPAKPAKSWRDYLCIPANALCGAVLGVSCYQWALATTPSGIVLPIVATAPLVIVPLNYLIDDEETPLRSFIGGAIAVGGVIALTLAR